MLLEVENLRTHFFTYAGTVKAVDGISFDVEEGETVAIVGESGCGKSMTALSVLRLVPDPPGRIVEGSIRFRGRELLDLDEDAMRNVRGGELAMVFQEPMTSLNPVLSIGTQLTECLRAHLRVGAADARARAVELLTLVGITDPERRLAQFPHHFSGGMRQRVMIAMALSCGPKLIIADEPTTALDVTIQAQILELMRNLTKRLGVALVIITHNLGVVARYADRVNVMYAGKIVEQGRAMQVYHQPAHPLHPGAAAIHAAARSAATGAAGTDRGSASGPCPPRRRMRLSAALPLRHRSVRPRDPAPDADGGGPPRRVLADVRGAGRGGFGRNGLGDASGSGEASIVRQRDHELEVLAGSRFDETLRHLPVRRAIGVLGGRKGPAEGQEARLGHLVEAAELRERFGMVVDPQIEAPVRLRSLDAECRRLLAPLVAARRLARVHGREQPVHKREIRVACIGLAGALDDAGPGEHVAGDAAPGALPVPRPVDAARAGEGGGAAVAVHQVGAGASRFPDRTSRACRVRLSRRSRDEAGSGRGAREADSAGTGWEAAPTPASVLRQIAPAAKNREARAIPWSPLRGSRAMMAQVTVCRSPAPAGTRARRRSRATRRRGSSRSTPRS